MISLLLMLLFLFSFEHHYAIMVTIFDVIIIIIFTIVSIIIIITITVSIIIIVTSLSPFLLHFFIPIPVIFILIFYPSPNVGARTDKRNEHFLVICHYRPASWKRAKSLSWSKPLVYHCEKLRYGRLLARINCVFINKE